MRLLPLQTRGIRQRAKCSVLTERIAVQARTTYIHGLLHKALSPAPIQDTTKVHIPVLKCALDVFYRNGNHLIPGPSKKPLYQIEGSREANLTFAEYFNLNAESDFD